ncbi:energy-coupling factor ABC transporter ATP-binding protein [Mobiluncus curtisii]|uniref:ABC transporter, ATP-binding protein n=1 Tax=Mobiluncus curtisii (strain ATCC 43063 / DSM 2711 / V125) TaxID=548479 RepID=D6ZJK9_MOBCV|nr:ABC transporter ATP-binding protein [Mobiluncus curtisii]ADI66908.1 ABC transporter, ATP-binding protein [Mobiluncus curtisii ATCC 43063]
MAIKTTQVAVKHPLAKTWALEDINLNLESGKVYGLMGANGSGKTTLCNTLKGLIPGVLGGEVKGKIEIFGKDLNGLSQRELVETIALVFENPYTQLTGTCQTVVEEIAFGLENLGWERERIIEQTARVICDMDLQDLAFRDPLELSGGQRQRVSVAAVMAMDTPVIVIDEPTSQLDPATTEMIFAAITKMKDAGKTVLLCENKIDQLVEIADEIIILDNGRVYTAGQPGEVLSRAKSDGLHCGFPELFTLSSGLNVSPRWITFAQAKASVNTYVEEWQ